MEKDRLLNIGYRAKEDEPWRKQGDKGWFLEISGHSGIKFYQKDGEFWEIVTDKRNNIIHQKLENYYHSSTDVFPKKNTREP